MTRVEKQPSVMRSVDIVANATSWGLGGAGAHRRLLSAVLAGAVLCASPLPAETAFQEDAGKQIYLSGESPSHNPLEAVLGEGSTTVPGTLMPCAGCHGADGKGRPEGGITPSDITWSTLTRPYRSDDALARQRPAYTVESLSKALREGIDPAGNELGSTMPRYNIADSDLKALIAYMRQLGSARDPGLTSTVIRIGTVVPSSGPLSPAGDSVANLLHAYFDELNFQGGVYGRKIELEVVRASGPPAEIAARVAEMVRDRQIFAVVGIFAPGAEREINRLLEKARVPVIDAFATELEEELETKSRIFHILSGLPQQMRMLVKYAQDQQQARGPVAVVYPGGKKALADALLAECRARSCRVTANVAYTSFEAEKIAARLSAQKVSAVFFLGAGGELESLLAAAQQTTWRPMVFQPGPPAGEEVFRIAPEFKDRVFFSFPTLPTDIHPAALEEYAFLVRKYKLAPGPMLHSIATLAPAKVFVEALRKNGRELDRDKLVETLSGLYNFPTGLTPPITYGTTRRVGALGAYVVKLNLKDKSFAPVEPWMAP